MNTENNILLAEFLGLKIITDGISHFDTNYKALKSYDSDWNHLMAVIQKIEIECKYDVNIYGHYNWLNPFRCKIVDNRNTEIVYQANDSKIQCVYDACVEFVQWFNKENNEK